MSKRESRKTSQSDDAAIQNEKIMLYGLEGTRFH